MRQFTGLFGDESDLRTPDFVQAEALEVRSKAYNWEIDEHFHGELFQLFLIESGGGSYTIDRNTFEFQPTSVLLVPANTLHGFRFRESIHGEVLTFSARIWQSIIKERPYIEDRLKNSVAFSFSEQRDSFERIREYYRWIQSEVAQPKTDSPYVMSSLIGLILTEIYRSNKDQEHSLASGANRSLNHYRKFVTLVKQKLDQHVLVKQYAEDLGISIVHLNRICKEIVGKTALEVVQNILIDEAKIYLLNTQFSIAEVAYQLNFTDPAYFNRLFKKKVGVTPGVFRRG
ncbi:helix-turn-helix domain-containing protein [Jiulongibacter sp. NS-SX5]|uniref:helix-turn-helix domain-containing protein n=1 Tax=Jiulongibacter sp. NS-SX5 TaxID=3463854 RepID=UPI0040580209